MWLGQVGLSSENEGCWDLLSLMPTAGKFVQVLDGFHGHVPGFRAAPVVTSCCAIRPQDYCRRWQDLAVASWFLLWFVVCLGEVGHHVCSRSLPIEWNKLLPKVLPRTLLSATSSLWVMLTLKFGFSLCWSHRLTAFVLALCTLSFQRSNLCFCLSLSSLRRSACNCLTSASPCRRRNPRVSPMSCWGQFFAQVISVC